MHTFWSAFDCSYTAMKKKGYCFGNQEQHKVFFDYVHHFWEAYPHTPKFALHFHAIFSHSDHSMVSIVDDCMVEHLKFFVDNGHLNNTILIAMSDHGYRFGELRSTAQGKLEERLPFVSFAFPPWFKQKFPHSARVFRENSHRLTNPFDIHATLREILNFDPEPEPKSISKEYRNRSLSLFHPIPADRTCAEAGIEPHWCTCLKWSIAPIDTFLHNLAIRLIEAINQKTDPYRDLCAEVKLEKIDQARIYMPSGELLRHTGSNDEQMVVPQFAHNMAYFNLEYYQLSVWTSPGGANYDAQIIWNRETNTSNIDLDWVSHVNRYGDQPHCIAGKDRSMFKWCKCYDKI